MSNAEKLWWGGPIMRRFFFLLSAALSFNLAVHAGNEQPVQCCGRECCSTDDGLNQTVTGYLRIKNVCVPGQTTCPLTVPGFCRPVNVYKVVQDHPAPLVIVLLGISGTATSDLSKLWPRWYAQAGYHVLTFNSTFNPEFLEIANRGVSGNIWSETECVRDIVNAFLATVPDRSKVTKIGVVGMSYGGVEALILGRMQSDGKLPFKLDAVQAYSPPIDMRQTAGILDDWYNQYRWNYTLAELYFKVAGYSPGQSEPLSGCILRAVIAASFQHELAPVIIANDKKFCLQNLDHSLDRDHLREAAGQWGFTRFAFSMALPWWRQHMKDQDIDSELEQTRLTNLLQHQPPCTLAVLAADDPFNTPEDLHELQQAAPRLPVYIAPRGGHLGYVSAAWTKAKLLSLFECGKEPVAESEKK